MKRHDHFMHVDVWHDEAHGNSDDDDDDDDEGKLGDTTLRLVWLGFGRSRIEPTKCPTTDPIKSP